jgi:hypothetical protein
MLPDPAINRRATVICPSGTKNLPKKQEALIFVPSGSDPLWRFGELPGCSCDQVKDEPMNPLGTGQRLADFALRKVLVRIGRSNIGPVPNDLIPNDLRCGKRSAVGYWTCPHRVFFAPGFSPNRDVFGRLSSSDRVIECYGKSCSNAANQNWANVCGSCPERRSCLLPQLINVRAVPARNERKLRIVGRSIGGFGLSRCGTVKLTLTAQNRERERRRKRLADYRGEDEASEFNFCSISSS